MLNQIQTIASAIAHHTVAASNYHGRGKLFEMWLMFRIADRLRRMGSTVSLHCSDGTPIGSHFRLRGAPGCIHPAGHGPGHPSFIAFSTAANQIYELHNSVEFVGRSTATHEYDICVISQTVGDMLRAKVVMESPLGHPLFALECKQYGSTSAGIGEARSMLGQLFDGTYWGEAACTSDNWTLACDDNGHTPLKASYLRFGRSFPALVAQGSISSGARELGRMFRLKTFGRVRRGSPQANAFLTQAASWLYHL